MSNVILTQAYCYVTGGVSPNVYTSVKITFDKTYTVAVSWNPSYPSQQSTFYIRDILNIPKVVLRAIMYMKDQSTPQQIIDKINDLLEEFQKDVDEMESILSGKLQPKLDDANRIIAELRESRTQDQEIIASLEIEVAELQKREQELTIWGELSSIHLDELELTNRELELQIDNANRIERDTILEDALAQLEI